MDKLDKKDGESMDLVGENLQKLRGIFPEAFTEDGIDFAVLTQLLGGEIAEGDEKYSHVWNGKKTARQIALTPSMGTLRPALEESVDWETTQNLFIEGDNLEVLKLLQKSYAGKVRMIYIDPPYNTGKEFVYPDRFNDSIAYYLKYTGQIDDEGMKKSTNTEAGGRKHTNWLNMMYPRLKVAKNLLADNGAIFISCDDNEHANIVSMCGEIFGEENFVGTFPWRSRTAKTDVPFGVSVDVEWVVCFAKPQFIAGRSSNRKYHESDDYDDRWRLADLTSNKNKDERPNSYFTMVNPRTGEEYPASEIRTWALTRETFQDYYDKGKIVFPGDYEFLNIKTPAYRVFESEDKKKSLEKYGTEDIKTAISTYLPEKAVGRTEHGSKEIRELFGAQVFTFPKPTGLIKFFVENSTDEEDIIMDFFAGSATTGDAVMQLNAADENSNRKYILVQLPEMLDQKSSNQKTAADFCEKLGIPMHIASLARERLKRAAGKIKAENKQYQGDLGFKVFKLDTSNILPWTPDESDVDRTLLEHSEHLIKERSEQDILYELLLKRGVDLSTPIEEKRIADKVIYSIGYGVLFACLSESISKSDIENIGQGIIDWRNDLDPASDTLVIFRDSAFEDDISKANMVAILQQNGIAQVRSL